MKLEKQTLSNQEVRLDGNEFLGCHFENCTMVYGGGPPPTLNSCSFVNVKWSFSDAASNTVNFMTALYHGAGEGGRKLIEQTFENIRSRRHPGQQEKFH